jgi:multidrug efflux pump subunit AcrA (membrane-fusion protein)
MVESSRKEEREAEDERQAGAPSASRSQLVQRLMTASGNLPVFINDLIATQATVVAGVEAAGFLIEQQAAQEGGETPFTLKSVAHLRPDGNAEQRAAAIAAFAEVIKPCVSAGKDGAVPVGEPDASGDLQYCLVTLLRNEGNVVAASAVIARCRDLERARQRLISMQLVAGYFDLYSLRRGSEQHRLVAQSHQHVLQLATAVATADGFEAAAMNLCNELASRTGASRVSIGWHKGDRIRVKALSNTEKFDKKQELIVQIERVMEECSDQEEIVQYDPNGGPSENVTREAANLSRTQGGEIVLSLPLRRQDEIIGIATLEFPADQPLSPNAASGLAIACDLLAPQLYDRHQNDRWLVVKTGHSIADTARKAVGPKHMVAKLIIIGILVVGAFMFLYRPMYKVSAPFQFVPIAKTSISAPYDGYLAKLMQVDGQFVGPNTVVHKGQVLAVLDTTDLTLRMGDALAKANAAQKEADADYSKGKIAEYNIALAQRDQAMAEADLYKHRIEQAKIVAPADGRILRGDLRDKIGSPIKEGDVLFEIADPRKLEAELSVADNDIRNLQIAPAGKDLPGSAGYLATSSLPTEKYHLRVTRIVPIGEAKDGTNVFKVYARMDGRRSDDWRPGMTGEARINVRPESLAWIWTHKAVDFLRLKLWM